MLQAASWAMGVQISHVADGACDPVLGTVAGTTIRARLSGATVVCNHYVFTPQEKWGQNPYRAAHLLCPHTVPRCHPVLK